MMIRNICVAMFGLVLMGLASSAHASLIGYNFFLEDTNGDVEFTGEFFIDENLSAPNTFYSFNAIMLASMPGTLSISIDGFEFELADVEDENNDGVMTDGTGMVSSFAVSGGGSVRFLNGLEILNIAPNNGAWTVDDTGPVFVAEGPTHSFAKIPEPGTLGLFAVGLTGLGVLGRRRKLAAMSSAR